jgi:hypothetical protein
VFLSPLQFAYTASIHEATNGTRIKEFYWTPTIDQKPLQVGDVCRAEARIISVMNANEGKIVTYIANLSSRSYPHSCIAGMHFRLRRDVSVSATNSSDLLKSEVWISSKTRSNEQICRIHFQRPAHQRTPFMSTPTSLTRHFILEPSLTIVDQCGY